MCHAIVWYHALCHHLDQSQSSTIPCIYATATGYDCLPHYQPVLDFPLSGECCMCKGERRWQQKQTQMHRKPTDNPQPQPKPQPASADMNDPANLENDPEYLEFLEERDRFSNHNRTAEDWDMHLWMGGADLLARGSETETNMQFDMELNDDSWYDEEFYFEDAEDIPPSLSWFDMGPDSDSESESEVESHTLEGGDFTDSPTLGYDSPVWGMTASGQQDESATRKSMIPVSVSGNKALERVWEDWELEVFDQLTF
ncbi:hypothetical protein N7454_011187 [Penicillium verhagenii]|nr:hypothetical protein N7454_011187 [Penicillium verhagenii]